MTGARVGIVFDNTLRPETTGVYCRRALGELVQRGVLQDVEHFLPTEWHRLKEFPFDWLLLVDDGLDYEIPASASPYAWWAIDTHMDFDRSLRRARLARWTFAAQKDGAERLRGAGIDAMWLPLACDPQRHGHQPVEKRYDVSFVGNLCPGERTELLHLIQQRFPNTFVGRRYFEEMAEVYSASRIVFNRSVANDVNLRVFEAVCSGSLLITNDLAANGQEELLRDGMHLVTYRDRDELLAKLEFYLRNEGLREQITSAGRAEVLARHTYRHRMETICDRVRGANGRGDVTSSMRAIRDERGMHAVCLGGGVSLEKQGALPDGLEIRPTEKEERIRAAVAAKTTQYFEFDRPDVLSHVPLTARKVLDVGCGAGRLGAAIKARQPAHVTGVELHPAAAMHAQEALDDVKVGNIETEDFGWAAGTFDCVIFADVLEHLRSPEAVLQKVRRWLQPDGCLITSLPNVRHHSVVQSLLAGNWTYESAGLLDVDHVRFFTRREIEKLLFRTGFRVDEFQFVAGEGYEAWAAAGRPLQVNVGGLQVRAATVSEAEEFFAYQYLTRSRPADIPCYGRTSIIIVTHNQLAYTRQCIDSLRLRTDEDYELIFVDNGSTDGTVDYLRTLPTAIVLTNSTNKGFPAAVNQALQRATGANILLLNNDTIVTTGWLRRMLDALHGDPRIGLVGPVSNQVSGEQQIDVPYGNLSELDGFAWDWGRDHGREFLETDRLVGFCLLIRREVIERIGGFDEQFGVGCYEDDDFCRRALAAGYRAIVARGAFVHHFGGITFRSSGVDFAALMHENQRRFDDKWKVVCDENLAPQREVVLGEESIQAGRAASESSEKQCRGELSDEMHCFFEDSEAVRGGVSDGLEIRPTEERPPGQIVESVDRRPPRFLLSDESDTGLLLIPNTMQLSVCLIVRNNESTIGPCLESIRPWVDEIVVVDTGSTDATPTICEELGARVFRWAWRDDFAAARNQSLRHARGAWIFWMDSDDTISADCGRRLRELVQEHHSADVLGYVMQVHCPGPDGDPTHDVTVVDHVKLFRNRPDICFEFRIHEQALPSIRRAAGAVIFTDIYVTHSGADHTTDGRARKLERDFRLLQLEQADRPDHPFVLFNLGMTYADAQMYGEAIESLRRCLERSDSGESHVRKAYALLIGALANANRHDEAWSVCAKGLELFPTDKELRFRAAMLNHHFRRWIEAERDYLRVLDGQEERHFSSIDTGIGGIKARHNLALVYEDSDSLDQAESQWRRIVAEVPDYGPGWRGLGRVLLRTKNVDRIGTECRRMIASGGVARCEGLMLHAQLVAPHGDMSVALRDLKLVQDELTDSLDPLRLRCELLFKYGTPEDAELALMELAASDPQDAAAHHNLGLARTRLRKFDAAVAAYHESLRLRPLSATTFAELGHAYFALGDSDQAMNAWRQALRLDSAAPCSAPLAAAESAALERRRKPILLETELAQPAPAMQAPDEIQPPSLLLSLCMIVRDSGKTLAACLSGICPHVDELIVVDTGSTDGTVEIARQFGAHVHHFSWCDDFSAARNESLRHATGDWIIWMDSDDTIAAESAEMIRPILKETTDPNCLGFLVSVRCPRPTPRGRDEAIVDQVRIFRNRPDFKFTGRVHEQILATIQQAGGALQQTELVVDHSGADYSPQVRREKHERNLRLLLLEQKEHPADFAVQLNLGMTHADAGFHDEAVKWLKMCLETASPGSMLLSKVYSLLVLSLMGLGQDEDAAHFCARGRMIAPDDEELLFHAGVLAKRAGRLEEAAEQFEQLIKQRRRTHLAGIDAGILGYKTHHNLAIIYCHQGKLTQAETEWRHAIRKMPEFGDSWKGLGEILKVQGKWKELRELSELAGSRDSLAGSVLLWRAEVAGMQGDRECQRQLLESACRDFPEQPDPQHSYCKFLLEAGEADRAEQRLQEILRRSPLDLAARHNLSSVYLSTKRYADAIQACEEALQLDPKSTSTRVQLGYALSMLGRSEDAISEWKQVLAIDPRNGAARAALQRLLPTENNGEQKQVPPTVAT